MNLYIRIENGQPVDHPAFEDNLIAAFGAVPADWQPFVRVERPIIGTFQVLTSYTPTYQNVNGTWTDVWDLRDMTEEETLATQQEIDRIKRVSSMPH